MTAQRPMALVTGGAVRVGRAICHSLARAGCDVTLTHLTNAEAAGALVEELVGLGVAASTVRLDLDDLDAVEGFGRSFASAHPALDVLVHNASVYEPTPLDSLGAADGERHFRVNALAPLLLTRRLAPALARTKRAGGGSIVCMCDIHASERPRKNFAAYAMSKAALEQMVRVLALELAPGVVAFPETGAESDPEMQARYLKRVPLGRSGTPGEAAEAVRWLALDATYTTGEVIRVDGGRWLG